MSARPVLVGAGVAAALALVAVPGAFAGGPIGGGPAGGLFYYAGTAELDVGSTIGRGIVCSEAGTRVIGGGFESDNATRDGRLLESYPYDADDADSKPDDGWFATASNVTSQDTSLTTYSICGFDPVKYVSKTVTVKPGKTVAVKAGCPDGTAGTAGGLETSPYSVQVSAVYPIDGADAGAKTDDGWKVQAFNFDTLRAEITAHAVCVRNSKTRYFHPPDTDQGIGQGGFGASVNSCEGASGNTFVTGGGVRPRPPLTVGDSRITAMLPFDYSPMVDPDTIPSDGIVVEGANDFFEQRTVAYSGACLVRAG